MDPRITLHRDSWWDWEDSTPNMQAAELSADHFLWLLQSHWVNLRTAKILELWSGKWYLAHEMQRRWINITASDARPRPFSDEIEIHEVDIEELSKIFEKWFFNALISRDVFDAKYYNQDIIKAWEEIWCIMWNNWLYIWKEPNATWLIIPDSKLWVIAWQFQIFRKWWWDIAQEHDFSTKIHI